jgi:hypothetical protein
MGLSSTTDEHLYYSLANIDLLIPMISSEQEKLHLLVRLLNSLSLSVQLYSSLSDFPVGYVGDYLTCNLTNDIYQPSDTNFTMHYNVSKKGFELKAQGYSRWRNQISLLSCDVAIPLKDSRKLDVYHLGVIGENQITSYWNLDISLDFPNRSSGSEWYYWNHELEDWNSTKAEAFSYNFSRVVFNNSLTVIVALDEYELVQSMVTKKVHSYWVLYLAAGALVFWLVICVCCIRNLKSKQEIKYEKKIETSYLEGNTQPEIEVNSDEKTIELG